LRHTNLKNILITLLFLCAIAAPLSANGFFDIRAGYSTHTVKLSNTLKQSNVTHLYIAPSVDINIGYKSDIFLSIFNLSLWVADTNSKHFINGTITNTELTNRLFYARAWSFSFTEYVPITIKDRIRVMPGIDVKFAHYNDISAGTEFTEPTTDYMYTFLRLALRTDMKISDFKVGLEYKYPLLGKLTDKLWNENRSETYFHAFGEYHYSNFYARIGYDRSGFTYSNKVTTGEGWPYKYRVLNTIYLAVGGSF